MRLKHSHSLASIALLTGILNLPLFVQAADNAGSTPPINASGAGMTNEQLMNTRPIQSGLKSIEEAQQAVDQIRDKAKDIVRLCTDQPPTQGPSEEFNQVNPTVTGGFHKMAGKYYKAPKWKLVEANSEINKQRGFLAETLGANQQDHRPLRASEETRAKVDALRAEARQLSVSMLEDCNKMSAALSQPQVDQSEMVKSARVLIKATSAVESKLKEMERVLKHELKN